VFQHHLQALTKLAKAARLPKLPEAVDKFSAQVSGMAACPCLVVLGTSQQDTVSQSTDEQLGSHCLLPVVYWQQQIDKKLSPSNKLITLP